MAERKRETIYQEVTDRIVAELEAGRVPWVQPWGAPNAEAGLGLPKNASTVNRHRKLLARAPPVSSQAPGCPPPSRLCTPFLPATRHDPIGCSTIPSRPGSNIAPTTIRPPFHLVHPGYSPQPFPHSSDPSAPRSPPFLQRLSSSPFGLSHLNRSASLRWALSLPFPLSHLGRSASLRWALSSPFPLSHLNRSASLRWASSSRFLLSSFDILLPSLFLSVY